MKKLLLLFLMFSLRAIDVAQEERLLKQNAAMLYQATQAADAANQKNQHGDGSKTIDAQPVRFDKSCCGLKGVDPFEACSFVCLTVSFCLQCLQG